MLGEAFNEEMANSAIWGALGGVVMQGALGPGTQNLFKSKDQKEFEKNYAKRQKDFIDNRGASFQELQKELALADQKGDPVQRDMVLESIISSMTSEALSLDQYDQHIESLENMLSMSKEEAEAFNQEYGLELDQELFKQSIPSAIETARNIRKRYSKHLNNNNTHQASISMAQNEVMIDSLSKSVDGYIKEIESEVNSDVLSVSERERSIAEKRAEVIALQEANNFFEKNLSENTEGLRYKRNKNIIKANESKIESLDKEIEKIKATDERTSEEKKNDKENKTALNNYINNTMQSRVKAASSNSFKKMLQNDISSMSDKKTQMDNFNDQVFDAIDTKIKSLKGETVEDLSNQIEEAKEMKKNLSEESLIKKSKDLFEKKIDKKITELEQQKKNIEKKNKKAEEVKKTKEANIKKQEELNKGTMDNPVEQ